MVHVIAYKVDDIKHILPSIVHTQSYNRHVRKALYSNIIVNATLTTTDFL